MLTGECGRIVTNWSSDDLAVEREKFLAHHEAKGSAFVDWDAAWRTWVLNSRRWPRTGRTRASEIGWNPVSAGAAHA